MKITGSSKIEFYKFKSSTESDEHNLYNLVRIDTYDTLKVDKNLIELIKLLSKGKTIQEAADEISFSAHSTLVMLKILEEGHFIKSVDGEVVDDTRHKIKPEITGKSKIEFHKLRTSSHPDEHNLYGIVRWDTDDTLRVDKNVIELVRSLRERKTIQEAAHDIKFSIQVVEMILKMLDEANFIKSIDGVELEDQGKKIKPWFPGTNPKWFRWLLSKPLIFFLLAISFVGIFLGIRFNGIPSYQSFFWTDDIFTVFVSLFMVDFFLIVIHEGAHFLYTKAVGGEAVMRINYRYIYIVAETESYHLGVVPKRLRYLVYLSGSIVDLILIGLIFWFLSIAKIFGWELGLIHNFFIALILSQALAIIWQFNVFLETDMYNFISEFLGMENLRNDAIKYIVSHTKRWKKILLFPVKKTLMFFAKDSYNSGDDFRMLSKSEKKKLFIYVLVLVMGMIFMTIQFIFYTIPRDYTYIVDAVNGLIRTAGTLDVLLILKSVIITVLVLFDYVLLIFLKIKEFRIRISSLKNNSF